MIDSSIKICPDHSDYPTPMIWTFKFPGAEEWCPFCGRTEGMFGDVEEVPRTPEMQKRLEDYKDKSADFLAGKTKDWEYNAKIEDIPA